MGTEGSERDRASSTERILDMLLFIARAPEGRSAVNVLAREFGLSRSSTYRYLQMLRSRDLIVETAIPGEVAVGPALALLAETAAPRQDLTRLAGPALDRLSDLTGEAVMITRRFGDRVRVIAHRESTQVVRIDVGPARDLPLTQGSPAKIHLAHLPPAQLARALAGLDPAASTRLEAELAGVRQRGYAASESEIEQGVCSLSVPVFGPDGEMAAGLTIAGPCFRLTRAARKGLLASLREEAERVAAALGAGKARALAEGGGS